MSPTSFRSLFAGAVFALALLLGAPPARGDTPDPPGRPLDVVRLQLKWKHQFQFAGYYAAQKQGFYRDAGLDVRLEEAPDVEEPAQVVLRGGAEFGIASSDLVLLRSQGKPVVALAAIYQHSPLVLLALKKSGVDHIHDLAGKRVMIEPHAAELLAYLEYESIPARKLVQLPHSFDTGALQRGEVDAISAYSTDEPFQLWKAGQDYLTFNPRAGGIDFYGDTLFTTEAQLKQHPARVRAFVDASLRGWQYALDHQEEMIGLIRREYSARHSAAHLRFEAQQMRHLILPDVVEIGYMNPGRWRHILDTYVHMGMASPRTNLRGFLYERNPHQDLTWLYFSLVGALLAVGLISAVAGRFYHLNTAIRREVAERVRAEADLRALEQRHRILAENAPFPIIITRISDGTVRYINARAAEVFAISAAQVVGQPADAFYESVEDRRALFTRLEEDGQVRNAEVHFRTGAGAEFWAALSASSIRFEEEPAAFVALMDISERKELELRLERMAMTDELTGLLNRRSFVQGGEAAVEHARCSPAPLSMLMLDADQFKAVNDTYGHEAGDQVLRRLAALLRAPLRQSDLLGRIGGEEFGVLLPGTGPDEARRIAERLRAVVAEQELECAGAPLRLTVSIGVGMLDPNAPDLDDLLRRTDAALYQAKALGRNRVEAWTGECSPGLALTP